MYRIDFGLLGLLYFIMEMAGTLFTSPMIKFLSWTIYLHDFDSYPLDREPSYEKAVFVSGLTHTLTLSLSKIKEYSDRKGRRDT